MISSFLLPRTLSRTYSIGQLCREFGLTARALRFYEEQGLVEPRRHGSNRVYSKRDRARVALITRGRAVGLTIKELRDLFVVYDEEGEAAQILLALDVFRRRLAVLEAQRASVDSAMETLAAACERMAGRAIAAA